MKKIFLPALFALFITACGEPTILSYNATFTTDNVDRMNALSLATRHVIERRLARLEANLIDYDIKHDKESKQTTISIEVDDAKAASALNEELLAPFTFEVRYLADGEPEEGDIAVEGMGSFRATGVEKQHIDWVLGEDMGPPQNQGKVIIGFTDEGVELMKSILSEQDGTTVGLFVRDRLTASLQVDGDAITRTIQIPGLPSADLAKIFADDVNVGIHMTFTPTE